MKRKVNPVEENTVQEEPSKDADEFYIDTKPKKLKKTKSLTNKTTEDTDSKVTKKAVKRPKKGKKKVDIPGNAEEVK